MFEPRSTTSQHAALALAAPATQLETRYLIRSSRASACIRWAAFAILALAPLAFSQTANAATTTTEGGAVTVTPGGTYSSGLRVAVVSATDTAGDAVTAQRALMAANMAIARTRGYIAVPQSAVASAMSNRNNAIDARGPNQQRGVSNPAPPFLEPTNSDTRLPVDAIDYKAIGKATKADRALSVIINRLDSSDTSATVNAIVEIYDTKTGGMVGRGESSFTSTVAADEGVAPVNANDVPVVNGRARTSAATAEAAQVLALGGAVYRAIGELNRPVEVQGVIVSMPEAYQARISMGERQGIRTGARVEFLNGDTPIAYGTVISAGRGESLVTVAPEAAFPNVFVNMPVRNVSNPVLARAGKSEFQLDDAEFRRFERDFGVGLLAAGLLYAVGAFEKLDGKLPLTD